MSRTRAVFTVSQRQAAETLYGRVCDALREMDRCVIVVGFEGEPEVIPYVAVDRWLASPLLKSCVLMTANRSTTLGDVEWLLQR